MKLTLKEWQNRQKPVFDLIVQASAKDGSDSWQPWSIGMSWQYTLFKGDSQIGKHENLVLLAITETTDLARRAYGVNRKNIIANLSNNGIKNIVINKETYYSELPTYKFIVSPEGNGIDCHRHYEALLAGSIPIIERNPLTEEKYKGCPVLWTTDYSEITSEYLLTKYQEFQETQYDFSCLFLSHFTTCQQTQIKTNGNYWVKRLTNKNWYKSMNVVYAFVGKLPSYSVETVFQTRLFYNGPIYFILDDTESIYIPILKQNNVTIINYNDVIDNSFNEFVKRNSNRFLIVPELKDRAKLFICSFERFYLLNKLMHLYGLEDVFFMELDNLIYDDPQNWLNVFSQKQMAYMFDNYNRSSSGIAYIKNTEILEKFLSFSNNYILTDTGFINEMTSLYKFWESNKSEVQLLPILWQTEIYPSQTSETFPLYNSIFDALSIGIYMGGADTTQTNISPNKGEKSSWGLVDYTKYIYKWKNDSSQRKVPYIFDGESWVKINNLHIHSKQLNPFLSSPIKN